MAAKSFPAWAFAISPALHKLGIVILVVSLSTSEAIYQFHTNVLFAVHWPEIDILAGRSASTPTVPVPLSAFLQNQLRF